MNNQQKHYTCLFVCHEIKDHFLFTPKRLNHRLTPECGCKSRANKHTIQIIEKKIAKVFFVKRQCRYNMPIMQENKNCQSGEISALDKPISLLFVLFLHDKTTNKTNCQMELYYSFAILIVIATIFSYINNRYLKLPATIGVMVIAMITSLVIVLVGDHFHKFPLKELARIIQSIDFSELLMGGMLNFLLFAGAIHINLQDLKEQKLPIIVFSSLSVIISTFVVGFGLYYILNAVLPMIDLHLEIPLVFCLLFGALISPTDPIAVLAILKEAKVSKAVETKVAGESLFNDGVAVVVFAVILSMTAGGGADNLEVDWGFTLGLLAKEVVGGILLGLILGKIAWYGMKTALDLKISVLITLSVVMGGYLAAGAMHFSGPLAMVVAGLIIGDSRRKGLAHKENSNNLNVFWQLIDEVLNAILFLFIGFELLLIPDLLDYWLIGVIAIVIVLFARYISIKIPTLIIPFKEKFSKGTIIILVWGGLRGAVSIALALSIAEGPYKKVIIAATYFVVVFSILVQGLSIGKLANKIKI